MKAKVAVFLIGCSIKGTPRKGDVPRERDDGKKNLNGVIRDIFTCAIFFREKKGFTIIQKMDGIDNDIRIVDKKLGEFFLRSDFDTFLVYYSGHGRDRDGAWSFDNGHLTPGRVFKRWRHANKLKNKRLVIISDSCHSGKWIDSFRGHRGNFMI
jgi:hypothetical protein